MAEPPATRALVVVGLGAVGLGLAGLVAPGALARVPVNDVVLPLLGLLALGQAARLAVRAWQTPRRWNDLPEVGRVEPAPVLGEAVDRAHASSRRGGHGGRHHRARLTRDLRAAARSVIAAEAGTDLETVDARLDAGTWTDDPVAAALFTATAHVTWLDPVRARLGRETTFQRRVRRAIGALERRVEGDGAP